MDTILIKNARLWDTGAVTNLLIGGERIHAIGPDVEAEDAQVQDLLGYTLYPGFFNAHVHLYGLNGPLPDELIRRFVQNGVTTVRDMGMTYDAPYAKYRRWLADRQGPEYPTILSAGKFICTENSYGAVHPTGARIGHVIDATPEAASAAVDEMVNAGADLIKTGNDYGMNASDPLDYLPEEVFRAIITRAKERGVPSAAHITKAQQFVEAAKLGLTEGAHVPNDFMTDQQVAEVAASGMVFTATMSVFDYAAIQFGENLMEDVTSNTGRLYRAGMPMAVGTDFMRENPPYQPVGIPVHEFRLLHLAGLSVEEIIRAATIDSARICGMERDAGSIEAGKLADLVAVLVPADETFSALEQVSFVMHRGVVVRSI